MESIISQIANRFKRGTPKRSDGGLRVASASQSGLAKFRTFLNHFFWGILVFLLLILTFFLGRVTKFMESRPAFTFESKEAEEKNYQQEKNKLFGNSISTSTIVASKGGKKYYFVWCKGAGNIKESNKRYFNTEELAQKAGYSLAANCQ